MICPRTHIHMVCIDYMSLLDSCIIATKAILAWLLFEENIIRPFEIILLIKSVYSSLLSFWVKTIKSEKNYLLNEIKCCIQMDENMQHSYTIIFIPAFIERNQLHNILWKILSLMINWALYLLCSWLNGKDLTKYSL